MRGGLSPTTDVQTFRYRQPTVGLQCSSNRLAIFLPAVFFVRFGIRANASSGTSVTGPEVQTMSVRTCFANISQGSNRAEMFPKVGTKREESAGSSRGVDSSATTVRVYRFNSRGNGQKLFLPGKSRLCTRTSIVFGRIAISPDNSAGESFPPPPPSKPSSVGFAMLTRIDVSHTSLEQSMSCESLRCLSAARLGYQQMRLR